MKPRKVKKLDPQAPLAENAVRILKTRSAEFVELAATATESGSSDDLHDARIAAKRLRYVLEVTGFCFGKEANAARKQARDVQDLLGEIHDCDVLLPRVLEHIEQLREGDARSVSQSLAPDGAPAIDDVHWKDLNKAPARRAYAGLEKLALLLAARRRLLLERFVDSWGAPQRQAFVERLDGFLGSPR
ncbi:MAG: CHAD domain-containing protein [Solirubrobacterales bacterium]